jgi:MFS superfamily sulfate permease-like transporter
MINRSALFLLIITVTFLLYLRRSGLRFIETMVTTIMSLYASWLRCREKDVEKNWNFLNSISRISDDGVSIYSPSR